MANDNHHVIVVAGPAELAKMAADRLIARISANAGRAAICLTGGSSPKQLYQLLATDAYRSRIPWDHVHWFIGDDRFVAADDPLNNMGMARRLFRLQSAEPCPPLVRSGADGRRPRRPHRLAISRLSGR
jgi:6-phosphogluconolactonase/glucosamine-6-phosphate isomerase/deaminase